MRSSSRSSAHDRERISLQFELRSLLQNFRATSRRPRWPQGSSIVQRCQSAAWRQSHVRCGSTIGAHAWFVLSASSTSSIWRRIGGFDIRCARAGGGCLHATRGADSGRFRRRGACGHADDSAQGAAACDRHAGDGRTPPRLYRRRTCSSARRPGPSRLRCPSENILLLEAVLDAARARTRSTRLADLVAVSDEDGRLVT